MPDVDYAYNRAFFYGGRALIVGTTGAYAAVDRLAVRFVRTCYWVGNNPTVAVQRVDRRLLGPGRAADGGQASRLYLRAGVGTTVLILGAVLLLFLTLSLLL